MGTPPVSATLTARLQALLSPVGSTALSSWRVLRYVLIGLPLAFAAWGVSWLVAELPPLFQWPLVITFAVTFCVIFSWIVGSLWKGESIVLRASEKRRSDVAGRELAIILIGLACGFAIFALVTYLITDQLGARLEDQDGTQLGYGAISELFVWHMLDVVPFAKVPETLQWDEPVTQRDGWTGSLLVAYKIVVLAPVIAAIAGAIERSRNRERPAPEAI
jgi:hypothetical protein